MTYLLILFSAFIGGMIQSVTGFGCGILVMSFLPLAFPLVQAASIATPVGIFQQVMLMVRYRKHIQPKKIVLPLVTYMVVYQISLMFVTQVPLTPLTIVFGFLMIFLAVYFLWIAKRLSLQASWKSAVVCSSLAGVCSAFFGYNGPPIALYFFAVFGDDKYGYLGTLQLFFFFTALYSTVMRIVSGLITPDLYLSIVLAMSAVGLGSIVGNRIVDKIDADAMRRYTYWFVGFIGVLTLFKTIF